MYKNEYFESIMNYKEGKKHFIATLTMCPQMQSNQIDNRLQ